MATSCEMVVGDVHGSWGALNNLINSKKPNIILQCGDFGFWPSLHPIGPKDIKNKDCKIFWCDGNHEDHWALGKLKNNEVAPNVFYMKRGSTLTLPDGRTVLFMGGAESVDRKWRTIGFDWFPDEIIKPRELDFLPDTTVDIVISHTCPLSFDMDSFVITKDKLIDPSRHALSYVLHCYKPKLWYFGHFHKWGKGKFEGCEWTALSMPGEIGWWTKLEQKNVRRKDES